MMPLVFVAGASAEPERVRWAMERVLDQGWIVALDWLDSIEQEGSANDGLSRAVRARHAEADMDGVLRADALWLLWPAEPSTGAYVELGIALASDVPVWISGDGHERCIYAALAEVCVDDDRAGLESLIRTWGQEEE